MMEKTPKNNRKMKGVILAGGRATRLYPLTLNTNKHLLLVHDKPVIYYVIDKMIKAGISEIMIITSPNYKDDFVELLSFGKYSKILNKIKIVYATQSKPLGIAHGLLIAKDYIGKDNCMLCLGDNIIEDDLSKYVRSFDKGSLIFLKKVKDVERFGIAQVDKKGSIINIEEKPKNPKSNLAVIGAYLYDNTLFKKFNGIKKSSRGEYEITDINNKYVKEGNMKSAILRGKWFDIGTFDSFKKANHYMKTKSKKHI